MLLIALAAVVIRLIALPWAQTVHADAVSRIHIAYEWMLDPHYITEGDWGPLHHYLNAFFMMIFPGKVLGPNVLNILCASLTAIPLYGFTLNLFNSRRGAIFASILYVFSPIVIWTSLQALSEVPFGFFLALALFFLSEGIDQGKGYRNAMLGGLFMTCAAALRYEAWVLIAVLTLVLLLQWNWKRTFVFWACAVIFPATWMLGNYLGHGDALYSVSRNDSWLNMEGLNDEVSTVDRVKRVVFFPWSLMLNMSPIWLILVAIAMVRAAFKKRLTRSQLPWVLPFLAMVFVFQQKAWDGSLSLHHRFVITWLILLLPFISLVFHERITQAKRVLVGMATVTVIPLAFFWNMAEYTRLLGDNALGKAMDELVMGHYREMQVVPRIYGPETEQLLTSINTHGSPGDGLIVDFFGWDKSYYIALHALPHTILVGGAKHEFYRPEVVSEFLSDHPHGQIVFSRTGMLDSKTHLQDSILMFEDVGYRMAITNVEVYRGLRKVNYQILPDADTLQFTAAAGRAFFAETPDAEFYDSRIRSEDAWYSSVRRQAFWKFEPVDSAVKRNVEYMLSLDAAK